MPVPAVASTVAPRPIRVLVADDSPSIREALCDLLSSNEDIEVVGEAEDADQAVALALRDRPDVVLVDVKMPGGGGPRAAREILANLPGTKVLALSAYEDRRTVLDMLREGAVGFVVKGTPAKELLDAVRRSAQGQGSLSAEITADVIQELSSLVERSESLARELQELNRDKSDLIQVLSHELLTPVTVFQSFATMVSERWDQLRRSEFRDLVKAVSRAGERMRRLVGNLEAAARLDREGMDAATRPVRVGELLTGAVAEFPEQAERIRLPEGKKVAGLRVWADPGLAIRALVAVVENALALSPPEARVDVGVTVEGGQVEVAVSDRGPGVPEEKRDRIFEAFTQVDSSTTRTHEGMGIGLYLTRRIMQAHGGSIDLTPRDGGGSTFMLRFPLLEGR
jgi:signal transduction histidine kinase